MRANMDLLVLSNAHDKALYFGYFNAFEKFVQDHCGLIWDEADLWETCKRIFPKTTKNGLFDRLCSLKTSKGNGDVQHCFACFQEMKTLCILHHLPFLCISIK